MVLVDYNNPDWDLNPNFRRKTASHIYIAECHYSKTAWLTCIACMFSLLLRWSTLFKLLRKCRYILSSMKFPNNAYSFVKKISLMRFNWRLIQLYSANGSQDTQQDKHHYYCFSYWTSACYSNQSLLRCSLASDQTEGWMVLVVGLVAQGCECEAHTAVIIWRLSCNCGY